MILIIDNYDSFVFNLARYVRELGCTEKTVRNDALTLTEAQELSPEGIILSPGPGRPEEAGICVSLFGAFPETPVLGICLGHQCLGAAYDRATIRAKEPVHGRASDIFHQGHDLFDGLPSPLVAGRYHSLIVEDRHEGQLRVQARSSGHEIMAMRHVSYPHFGVQFHPESLLTPHGKKLISNFLTLTKGKLVCSG